MKLIFLIFESNKANIEDSGWQNRTKIPGIPEKMSFDILNYLLVNEDFFATPCTYHSHCLSRKLLKYPSLLYGLGGTQRSSLILY